MGSVKAVRQTGNRRSKILNPKKQIWRPVSTISLSLVQSGCTVLYILKSLLLVGRLVLLILGPLTAALTCHHPTLAPMPTGSFSSCSNGVSVWCKWKVLKSTLVNCTTQELIVRYCAYTFSATVKQQGLSKILHTNCEWLFPTRPDSRTVWTTVFSSHPQGQKLVSVPHFSASSSSCGPPTQGVSYQVRSWSQSPTSPPPPRPVVPRLKECLIRSEAGLSPPLLRLLLVLWSPDSRSVLSGQKLVSVPHFSASSSSCGPRHKECLIRSEAGLSPPLLCLLLVLWSPNSRIVLLGQKLVSVPHFSASSLSCGPPTQGVSYQVRSWSQSPTSPPPPRPVVPRLKECLIRSEAGLSPPLFRLLLVLWSPDSRSVLSGQKLVSVPHFSASSLSCGPPTQGVSYQVRSWSLSPTSPPPPRPVVPRFKECLIRSEAGLSPPIPTPPPHPVVPRLKECLIRSEAGLSPPLLRLLLVLWSPDSRSVLSGQKLVSVPHFSASSSSCGPPTQGVSYQVRSWSQSPTSPPPPHPVVPRLKECLIRSEAGLSPPLLRLLLILWSPDSRSVLSGQPSNCLESYLEVNAMTSPSVWSTTSFKPIKMVLTNYLWNQNQQQKSPQTSEIINTISGLRLLQNVCSQLFQSLRTLPGVLPRNILRPVPLPCPSQLWCYLLFLLLLKNTTMLWSIVLKGWRLPWPFSCQIQGKSRCVSIILRSYGIYILCVEKQFKQRRYPSTCIP